MTGVRAQLNLLVAATTSLVLIAFLVPLGILLSRTAYERAVAAATQQAQAAAALVALGQSPSNLGGNGEPSVTVFYPDGRTVGLPAQRTPSITLAGRGQAFTASTTDGGVEVLLPVEGLAGGTTVVRSYAPGSLLREGVVRTQVVLGLLGLALFLIGVLLADRLGRRLVGSVTDLAATADRLAAGDLTARVTPSRTPELRRVGVELNRLAGRIQGLLAEQREEVADLAHRLRTPVTALRLDSEALADADERARLTADVDALGRAVDEVIRTARRPVREGVRPLADLTEVTAERTAFWSALAEETGRPVDRRLPEHPVLVRAARDDLVAALDALLDNVFSHTPDGAALRVTVAGTPAGGGRLTIEDAGPGMAEGVHRGQSGGGSTGLGLDIAKRTAGAAGGSFRLERGDLGGLRVELEFVAPD